MGPVKSNQVVNTFIENKKLELGPDKCHKIHCGNKSIFCPNLKVHDKSMQDSVKERYQGDQIHESVKNGKTLSKRTAIGYAILSDIIYALCQTETIQYRRRLTGRLEWPVGF